MVRACGENTVPRVRLERSLLHKRLRSRHLCLREGTEHPVHNNKKNPRLGEAAGSKGAEAGEPPRDQGERIS